MCIRDSIFTENQQLFFTNRVITNNNLSDLFYGLKPERATNFGFSIDKGFNFLGGQGNFIIDYYKTNFQNKIITDFENPAEISFYNSKNNESNSSSFQSEIIFSKIGVSCLHGPHQGAQKSTTTNFFVLSSSTLVSKSISLTSMILLFSICF